jgi:hypothetical protein
LRLQQLVRNSLALLLAVPGTGTALELGEASVQSALGQVLQVAIPYRLATTERLVPECVSLVRSPSADDSLPAVVDASRVTITSTHIQILGSARVREPLLGLNVRIRCSSVPHIVRSYQLFIDPPVQVAAAPRPSSPPEVAPVVTAPGATTLRQDAAPAVERASRPAASPRARGQTGDTLLQGQSYRVVRGDTVSGIAARVANRPGTLWQTVDAIFAANPQAFTNANLDRIEEGRSITIPVLTSSPTATIAAAAAEARTLADSTPPTAARSEPALDADAAPVVRTEPLPAAQVAPVEPLESLSSQAPAASLGAAEIPIPETTAVAAPTLVEPAREDAAQAPVGSSVAWMLSLLALGGGFALLLSLTLVARRERPLRAQAAGDAVQARATATIVADAQTVELPAAPIEVTESWVTPTALSAAESDDPALAALRGEIDSVDLDVGAPVTMTAGVNWFSSSDAQTRAEHDTLDGATVRMPDVGDELADRDAPTITSRMSSPTEEDLTMTVVELDLLRQDYEAEHTLTLTQQLSQELSDALADLAATKAAGAADAGSPRAQDDETDDAADDATAALPRAKIVG